MISNGESLTTLPHDVNDDNGSLQARVPAVLHRRVRIAAAKEGVHIRDFVIPALEQFLDRVEEVGFVKAKER